MNITDPDYKKIGKIIAKLRKERNWSQKDVADEIGISFQSVSKWEHGEVISFENLYALSRLFGVSIDYLLGRSKYKTMDQDLIGRMTGLSPDAVRLLCTYKTSWDRGIKFDHLFQKTNKFSSFDFINQLLTSEYFDDFMMCFIRMCEARLQGKLAEQGVKLSRTYTPPYYESTMMENPVSIDADGNIAGIDEPGAEIIEALQIQSEAFDSQKYKFQTIFANHLDKAVEKLVSEEMITDLVKQAAGSTSGSTTEDGEYSELLPF